MRICSTLLAPPTRTNNLSLAKTEALDILTSRLRMQRLVDASFLNTLGCYLSQYIDAAGKESWIGIALRGCCWKTRVRATWESS